MIKNNQNKWDHLRSEFSKLTFSGYNIKDSDHTLSVAYEFDLDGKFVFRPELKIPYKTPIRNAMENGILDNLVFNIGMVEMISYWKAACPPEILIKPFHLSAQQIDFWKKLYYKGLGEFFYLNGISPDFESFIKITSISDRKSAPVIFNTDPKRIIVPVGGGKDSAVSLALLKDKFEVFPFLLNPLQASLDTARVAGFSKNQILEIYRTIDPQLLRLNEAGYLNGHTPFSALLAFISLLVAALSGAGYIALSNESSANEPTVKSGVNHQYSKSFEFERDFRKYTNSSIGSGINYFSFLRPLNEYHITRIFSELTLYHDVFRSCNVGSKTGTWCGKCPKCLFTFIMLSQFMGIQPVTLIFGKNLFEDSGLVPVLNELTGFAEVKPCECVGTTNEVNVAMKSILNKQEGPLPVLLKYYKDQTSAEIAFSEIEVSGAYDENHYLDEPFLSILKNAIHV